MQTIAIIGGGASGTLVAANLLRTATSPLRVVMIDRSPPMGRGVAYGTDCAEHLLNVPAGRMGAFPDHPEHFYQWVAERVSRVGFPTAVTPADFLPRRLYGEYLYSVLKETRDTAPPGVTLEMLVGEAVDLEENADGGWVLLADGRGIAARKVVLALGNLPGEYPIRRSLRFYHGSRYVHIPWREDALAGIKPNDDVLIVGAGLTAVDVAVQLSERKHEGKIHAVSRRGLFPQVHKAVPAYPHFLANEPLPATVTGALHRVRAEVKKAAAAGIDWRAVVDAIRPQAQSLWRNWPWEERARFMRHLRPYWEVHRHRLAPEIAGRIEALRAEGRLFLYAGRLQSLTETPAGAQAVFRRRGSDILDTVQVAKVINCTGPRSDYSKYQHPLLINLLARSLIDHDPLALGLNALPGGEVLRYRGNPSGWLFTLGAPLKGVLWECTAMAEIRVQARALAAKLLLI